MGVKIRASLVLILSCFFIGSCGIADAQNVKDPERQNYADPSEIENPQPADAAAAAQASPSVVSDTLSPSADLSAAGKGVRLTDLSVSKDQKISLDLKGIDIVEFLRILSLKMGVTIVPSRSVSGRINIFLNNLTLDDALDVVLLSQDLAADRKGSVISIMTAGEYEKLYGKKYYETRKVKTVKLMYGKPATVFSALSQLKSDIGKVIVDESSGTMILIDIPEKLDLMMAAIGDLDKASETEIFDLKYAKPADIKAHLSSAITAGPGELYVDEKTSKVVVSDLPEKMVKIKKMMSAFDEPTPQVLIESDIIQITLNKEFQKSINWERIFRQGGLDGLDFVGSFPVNPSFSPSPSLDTASLKMSVGTLASDDYTTTIKFLESLGDAKVLSSPRITVINNQEAKVLVGTREAYITSTQSQAETTTITSESVQFIDVGVKLSLLPTINKDGFITIKIKPEVSRVSTTITTDAGSRVPIVETSEAETVVKVKNGTMIMIAGLMKEEKREDLVSVPWVSKIPLIGFFFNSKAKQAKKTELIVFLTPHIFTGEVSLTARDIQEMVPADVTTQKMQEMIIDKKIGQIKPKAQAAEMDGQNPRAVKAEEKEPFIESKMKGMQK